MNSISTLGAVAESVEHGRSWVRTHSRVKQMTYKIDTWCSTLLREGKVWLDQCKDNVTEWDIRSWC